jgi:ribosomal protein L17
MRHRMKKFGHFKKKDLDHRNSMIRNLLTSFFLHKEIVTTEKRALAISGKSTNSSTLPTAMTS